MKKVFERIYREKRWYNGSGSGSLPKNTIPYRRFLQRYFRQNSIKKVIDIGCGDWQFSHLMNWKGIDYLGIDVVPSLIRENTRRWGNGHIHFRAGDAFQMQLPLADVVILKDVLQHWPIGKISIFLKRIKKYPRVLLFNTSEGPNINGRIKTGSARPIDVRLPPFNIRGKEVLRYRSW